MGNDARTADLVGALRIAATIELRDQEIARLRDDLAELRAGRDAAPAPAGRMDREAAKVVAWQVIEEHGERGAARSAALLTGWPASTIRSWYKAGRQAQAAD